MADKLLAGMTILVVDDSQPIRSMMRNVLNDSSCAKILEAHDGIGAMRLLDTNPVDIVLMEYHMPFVDGIKVARYIRKSFGNDMIIGIITGETDQTVVSECQKVGVDTFIIKPFSASTVKSRLQAALKRKPKVPGGSRPAGNGSVSFVPPNER